MTSLRTVSFDDAQILQTIANASDGELDLLDFGLIGFDVAGVVRAYNAYESKCAGLSPERVKNHPLFTVVAPCMNNFLVAQRFEDAASAGAPLDVKLDYVLTLRMKPVKVKLRLLFEPDLHLRYVLVLRRD